jgi:hypothetical protein
MCVTKTLIPPVSPAPNCIPIPRHTIRLIWPWIPCLPPWQQIVSTTTSPSKVKSHASTRLNMNSGGEILAPGNISVNTGKLEGSGGIDEAWGKISWKPLVSGFKRRYIYHSLAGVGTMPAPVPNSPHQPHSHSRGALRPHPAPPTFYCVKKLNDNSVRVRWEYDTTDKFFAYHLLYRKSPSGEVRLLGKFMKGEVLEFIDNTAIAQNFNNYCYYAKRSKHL